MDSQFDETEIKRTMKAIMNDEMPEHLEKRLERSLHVFHQNLQEHPLMQSIKTRNRRGGWFHRLNQWNLAWTAIGIFALCLIASVFMIGNSTPTWAEVTRQFQTVPFFHASVYFKEHTLADPFHFEMWKGEDGHLRLHFDGQIIFVNRDGFRRAFDVRQRKEIAVKPDAVRIIEMLNAAKTFSLESVIQCFAGNLIDLRPVPNRVEGISNDLSIFNLTTGQHHEWIRIWALRESLLPIFLKKWDPRKGESVEVFFSYLDQQPALFFDPNPFADHLKNPDYNVTEIVHAFLHDPGGLPVATKD
jgi:hypothetical protein